MVGEEERRTRELELNRLSAPKDKSIPSSCEGVNLQPTRKGEFQSDLSKGRERETYGERSVGLG